MARGEAGEVRILAYWLDDPLESPITLDVRLDNEGKITGKWRVFGATGMDTDACRPFSMDAKGTLDFGANAAPEQRHWSTTLRQCQFNVGSEFIVTWSGGDKGVYRVEKIAVLGRKTATSSET